VEFLDGLKEKSKGIRFAWFRGQKQTVEDMEYVNAIEDILQGIFNETVTYDQKEIERADKKDGIVKGY